MPASMIRADTGGSAYVAGSSMAMVATGPMPGSTPISVPSRQPMKPYRRLIGVKATPKPMERLVIRSMVSPSTGNEAGPHRELQFQQQDEGEVAADRQHGGEDRHLLVAVLFAGHAGDEGERVDRDDQAHRRNPQLGQAREQHAEHQVGKDDEEQRLPGERADQL